MKEIQTPLRKTTVNIVSRSTMTEDQQRSFQMAVNALLVELIKDVDRHVEGDSNEGTEEQVAGFEGNRSRTSE